MKWSFRVNQAALAGILASLFLAFNFAGNVSTLSVPTMTIQIYNDSDVYSIYPVLSTGAHASDTWMQAAFKIPKAKLADNPYPTPDTFRLYFNPTGAGIPPGQSVTLSTPLYTQLVPADQIDLKSTKR